MAPGLVIVDVDLSRPGVDRSADETLRRKLLDLPDGFPPLLLGRTRESGRRDSETLPVWRHTLLHDEPLPSQIHWVHPYFSRDRDRVVRRWRLVELGCFEGQPRWVPSPQLMADILLSADPRGWNKIQAQLEQRTPADCAGAGKNGALGLEPLAYLGTAKPGVLALDSGAVDQRVIYSYSWPERDNGRSENRREVDLGRGSASGSSIFRALTLLQDTENHLGHHLEDRIVVIGASYADSHGHPTRTAMTCT